MGFLLVLAIATTLLLRQFGSEKIESGANIPASNGPTVKVQSDENVNDVVENQVLYTEGGFSPEVISIEASRGLGCAINIQNKSSHNLKLGLSPHQEPRDPGPDYPVIPAGQHFLFDPRFTGYTELRFHDHQNQNLNFLVKFEKSCR